MTKSGLVNRQWLLASRPKGQVKLSDFEYRETPFERRALQPGEILLQNQIFSCAPTMRNFLNEPGRSYRASVPLGAPVAGVVGSEVIDSRDPAYPVGTLVSTIARWEDYSVLNAQATEVPVYPVTGDVTLMDMMGPLSLNSLTAYFGLFSVAEVKAGETVLISGAAGSVGSMACQFARMAGCHVIGVAGGRAKCDWLLESMKIDHAIDYKAEDVSARLKDICPDGLNAYFDNVGGEILNAAVDNMAIHGRIAVCGQVSAYDSDAPAPGPRDMMKIVYRRIRMQGFVLGDFAAEVENARGKILGWYREGRIVARLDVRHGFEQLPSAFLDLFKGANEGTLLVTNRRI